VNFRRTIAHGLERGAVRFASAFACAVFAACSQPPAAPPVSAETSITCAIDRSRVSVRCLDSRATTPTVPAVDTSGSAITLTLHGVDVAIETSEIEFRDDRVTFALAVRNLIGQRLGTINGASADPRGVHVDFVTAPTSLSAASETTFTVATVIVDSLRARSGPLSSSTNSATARASLRFPEMLDSGAVSQPVRVSLYVPATAQRAQFAIVVRAPVQHPSGWLRVVTSAGQAIIGTTRTLSATHRDASGRVAPAPPLTWRTTTDSIATLSPSGKLTGVRAGLARVTVECNSPCASHPDSATLAVSAGNGVTLTIDPRARAPISRFVYGMNFITDDGVETTGVPPWFGAAVPHIATLNRIGGNRFSAYNWRNNFSNAGSDYRFQNDRYVERTTTTGEAIHRRIFEASMRGAATMVTVPMLPFVAANDQEIPLDTLAATRAKRMREHFVPNRAGRTLGDAPGTVYQDQFVQWIDSAFPNARTDATRSIFFSLDNEPDIWHATHRAIMSDTLGAERKQTYDVYTETSIAFARAIKRARPQSLIFAPAVATYAGVMNLGQHPSVDPQHGSAPFFEVFLDKMRVAEGVWGTRLLDVLDLHWYPASHTRGGGITNDWVPQDSAMIETRLQAPRSLWDSTYDEKSWVSEATDGPVALIPRLRAMVAKHYRGTRLSISEYYFGRGGDISGGLAQADVLGIFGREGLFAATLWPHAAAEVYGNSGTRAYAYIFGAFRLFRDYDGAGGTFGDVAIDARSSDPVRASVYASVRADGKMILIVINKSNAELRADIPVTSGLQPKSAQVFTMRHGLPSPVRGPDLSVNAGGYLSFPMPAFSASTIVLDP
jgi:Glycoside hydrolase family 44